MKKLALVILLLLSASGFSETKEEAVISEILDEFSSFDGIWKGHIRSPEREGRYPDTPFEQHLMFKIEGDDISIGFFENGAWLQSPYEYELVRHKTHAVIYTLASDNHWVEGMTYLLTFDDIDELRVLWSRSVNNYLVHPHEIEARAYFQGISIFVRHL